MYICRHCGLEYKTDEAVMCVRCQAPKGKGTNFCPFCGARVEQEQKICVECGIDMDNYGAVGVKSKIAAGLLAIFLGNFGVHNFYLGYIKKAVAQLVFMLMGYVLYFVGIFSFVDVVDSYFFLGEAIIGGIFAFILAGILTIAIRIWSFIEGVMILCGKIEKDGKGRYLK